MAELCKQCFIATWHPNAYDRAHIVMSDDYEHCEGCCDCVQYVKHIDPSDFHIIGSFEDLVCVVMSAREGKKKIACVECGSDYENDDLAFIHETGECPYCHNGMYALWTKT